jgi:hypothetical protein
MHAIVAKKWGLSAQKPSIRPDRFSPDLREQPLKNRPDLCVRPVGHPTADAGVTG